MKRLTCLALILALALAAFGEAYRVRVKRIGQDLYQDLNTGIVIQTQYCYEYSYGDDAILVWEGEYSFNNKLIFQVSGNSYRVLKLMR
ncbi:MAG: hypothetical protein AMXMBFR33_61480 [Candidatus Xenobia bacterium]